MKWRVARLWVCVCMMWFLSASVWGQAAPGTAPAPLPTPRVPMLPVPSSQAAVPGGGATSATSSTSGGLGGLNDMLRIVVDTGQGPGKTEDGKGGLSITLQLLFIFTLLSLVPGILVMMTSFVRLIIVFSFLRQALTVQQPPNQVFVALALFMTGFIMSPTLEAINKEAIVPMRENRMSFERGVEVGAEKMKQFMLRYTSEKELRVFIDMQLEKKEYASPQDVPMTVLIPAFMVSELKTGFQMGLLILLPFLVIDLVIASILMALGMMMLPPPIIALPLKLMIFVLVDGWGLIVTSAVNSFKL
jgi:flagellar biosynthetic protein FliP